MMKKEWFILVNDQREGPFSIEELKSDQRITPDTLAWKKGMGDWKPIRDIDELDIIFKDETKEPEEPVEEPWWQGVSRQERQDDQVVLQLRQDPPVFLYWLTIIILIIVYVLFKLNETHS